MILLLINSLEILKIGEYFYLFLSKTIFTSILPYVWLCSKLIKMNISDFLQLYSFIVTGV